MLFKKTIILLLLLIVLFFIQTSSLASHIVGGEVSYKLVNKNQITATLEITLNLYRDPLGIDFDPSANFGIFRHTPNNGWESYHVIKDVIRGPIINIVPTPDPCKTVSIGEDKLESTNYIFQVDLEIGNEKYMISYQKCCRNYSINNVISVGNIGAVYDIIITPEALRQGNNSPNYKNIPPQYICSNFDLFIDHSAVDIDGDSLVYKFCTPYIPVGIDNNSVDCCGCINPDPVICAPPYDELVFINPYSAEAPIIGNPDVSINTNTGVISGKPNLIGAYVVAICVEEYRNGILLSTVRRDFEFNVVSCISNLSAEIKSDTHLNLNTSTPIAYFESCGELNFQFENLSTNTQFIDDYSWVFYDRNQNIVFEDRNGPRDLDLNFPNSGEFEGTMIINYNQTCFDTAFLKVVIPENISLNYEIEFDSCVVGPVLFSNISRPADISYTWDFGDNNSNSNYSPSHEYQARGTYEVRLKGTNELGCIDSISQILNWNPHHLAPPDTIYTDTLICYNDSIYIYNQWIHTAGLYFDYIPSTFSGCDSIIFAFNIDFTKDIEPTYLSESLCKGDIFNFNSRQITENGLYFDTLKSNDLCDSLIYLEIEFSNYSFSQLTESICDGELYNFNSILLDEPGIYYDTLLNQQNCDSIIELNLTLNISSETFLTERICEDENYNYNDSFLIEAGIYEFLYSSSNGCDSLVTLTLEIEMNGIYNFADTICFGETYAFGQLDLSLPGIYYDTITNPSGCDSLMILDLKVGENLSRIEVDNSLVEEYGSTIYLNTELNGESLINNIWYESDSLLSESLELQYLLQEDNWIFFESINGLYCIAKDSIFVKATLEKNIYIPNIFSPNGDGLNDLFYLGSDKSLKSSKLWIYDRWGNVIYEGETISEIQESVGWNGTRDGKKVEAGVYTYFFELEFINQDKEVRGGSVHLLR